MLSSKHHPARMADKEYLLHWLRTVSDGHLESCAEHNSDWLVVSVMVNGEGTGTPLQYSCLENPMDGGAWWAAVHGVAKSRTRLSDLSFTFPFHALEKVKGLGSACMHAGPPHSHTYACQGQRKLNQRGMSHISFYLPLDNCISFFICSLTQINSNLCQVSPSVFVQFASR